MCNGDDWYACAWESRVQKHTLINLWQHPHELENSEVYGRAGVGSLLWSRDVDSAGSTYGSSRGQGAGRLGQPKSRPPRASGDAGTRPALAKDCQAAGAQQWDRGGQPQTSKPGWQ